METRATAKPLRHTEEERMHALSMLARGVPHAVVREKLGIKRGTLEW